MPTDSLLLSIAIFLVFLVFAVVVAWIDHSTSRWLRARAAEKQPTEQEPYKKAA